MQIKAIYPVILLFFLVQISCKTASPFLPVDETVITLTADVKYLASDELEGRETGTEGERKAAAYISERFTSLGLTGIFGDDKSFFQEFQKTIRSNPHADEPNPDDPVIIGRNVGAFLDKGAAYTIIIGAHYDHLGYGAEGSLYTGPPAIHNGADDNASGVAAMLGLAQYFKDKSLKTNILFLAFSGEEKGLWGSNFFVDNSPLQLEDISYMINMDMVGRLNEDTRKIAIYGNGTSPIWDEILPAIRKPDFSIKYDRSGVGPSDHTSFYLEDIPVLHFFTGQHEDYHRPTDDYHKLNYPGIWDVINFISQVILKADSSEKIVFTKTKDASQDVPDFKVTLGVIPDYLFDGKGMRIDGVREDRPAYNAGILKGDVVVKMGDLKVVDMMTYMKALGAFNPGETVPVTVVREGDMMIMKEVTF